MTRLLAVFAALLALGVAGCESQSTASYCKGCVHVKGSGILRIEDRQVGEFTAIEHDNVGQLIVEQGEFNKLSIETDDNVLAVLTSEVRNGVLRLGTEKGKSFTAGKIVYRVTVKQLERLTLRGTGDIEIKDIAGSRLRLEHHGVGSVLVSGKLADFEVQMSGTGSLKARALEVARANIVMTGVGSAEVNVSEHLDVRLSGVGSLRYHGTPRLKSVATGVGKVLKA